MISCPLCSTPNFPSVDSLRTSLVTVATSPLKCPICSETLMGLDKLTVHLFGHVKENFKEEIERRIDSYCDGNKCKEEDMGEAMRCDICGFCFSDRNLLEMHQKLLHQTTPDKTGSYSYHCHLCSKKFRMRGSLMVHLRVAHYGFGFGKSAKIPKEKCNDNKEIEESNSTSKEPDQESKIDSHRSPQGKHNDNKHWECDVCSKLFTTKYFLKKHKRLHTGEMPYCCSLCNKSFTFQQSYHKHMLYHSSEKPYVCNECGRAFKELSTLQNHARIHSGERPFGCETCGKTFRQRVSYLVHRRIHTGVMPYKCTACEKTFRYKVSQKSHKCPVNPPGNVVKIPDVEKDNHCTTQKTSIFLGENKEIEISYNRLDLENAMADTTKNEINGDPPVQDGFSMVLSPILPEVESLCLNGSPSPPTQENLIEIIPEKSLEDFLQ